MSLYMAVLRETTRVKINKINVTVFFSVLDIK